MYIYCVTYVSEVIVEEKNDQIHPFPRRKGEREDILPTKRHTRV